MSFIRIAPTDVYRSDQIDSQEYVDLGANGLAKKVVEVDSDGNSASQASTATLANVSGSASSVTLLAANTSRKGASFYNDSTAILYLKFGSSASSTSFTVKLFPESFFEMRTPIYTGIITGIWASATGACRVTELT